MKRHIFIVTGLATALSFSACNPQIPPRKQTTVSGPSDPDQPRHQRNADANPDDAPPVEKKKVDATSEPPPIVRNKVPEAPKQNNPEYALKADGKPGYVRSPYDSEHRLIDVRGLPPGTEAECPYTHRTFLVPP